MKIEVVHPQVVDVDVVVVVIVIIFAVECKLSRNCKNCTLDASLYPCGTSCWWLKIDCGVVSEQQLTNLNMVTRVAQRDIYNETVLITLNREGEGNHRPNIS